MLCLDTYALAEISKANPKFAALMDKEFIITDITLAEFYLIILKEYDELTANYWYKKMSPYSKPADKLILVKAMKYKHINRKKNLSFFDCVGYVYSMENAYKFVTGDKEFEGLPHVEFIK
jgi:predicted nucleic acid-binding protein